MAACTYTINPAITRIYCRDIPGKMRAVAVRRNQLAKVQLQILDDNGDPINLTTLCDDEDRSLAVRLVEAVTGVGECGALEAEGTEVAPATGTIEFEVPKAVTKASGVYLCEAAVIGEDDDEEERVVVSNTFYLLVERGLFGNEGSNYGPPGLNEIRTNLRDQPELNRLTDEFDFDLSELCEGLVRTVNQWNSMPPLLGFGYNTQNFPWRNEWLDSLTAYLFGMAATYFRRNHLPYQATGLAVDDLNKFKEYEAAWMAMRDKWENWVRANKAQINMENGWGILGSAYDY